MSRIHDALKRAEQERASQPVKEPGRVRFDPPTDTFLAPEALEDRTPDNLALPSGSRLLAVGDPTSFEALAERCASPEWRFDPKLRVFDQGPEGKIGTEAFRTLRSRLYQIATTRPLRRILITSSAPAEGKSFVAANIAQALVKQRNCRVLLIDGDLRVGRLHQTLGAPSKPGLANYLGGEVDEVSVVQLDRQTGLAFIPAGDRVADASELILSDRMKRLLDTLTPAFDWVIIDSPPALAVHDASLLADRCDGVLFVVQAGRTAHQDAMKAAAVFRGESLLGVVLNQVEKHDFYASYYYSTVSGDD